MASLDIVPELEICSGNPSTIGLNEISSKPTDDALIEPQRRLSFLNSVVSLGMTAMGLGVLGMPIAFAKMGYVLAPIVAVFFAIVSAISIFFLCRVCATIDKYSFEDLSKRYLGFYAVRYTNWAFILQLFFVYVAFLSIPMMTVEKLIYEISYGNDVSIPVCYEGVGKYSQTECGSRNDCPSGDICVRSGDARSNTWGDKTCRESVANATDPTDPDRCFCTKPVPVHRFIIGLVIAIFTGCLGSIRSLNGISPVSNIAFFCLVAAVVLYFIEFHSTVTDPTYIVPASPVPDGVEGAIAGLGTIYLAYNCQYQVISCQKEMKQPQHIYKLGYLTMFGMCMPLYILIGMTGMFLAADLEDNVFDSLNTTKVATAGKWLVCIMVIMKIPLVFNPMRDYIFAEFNIFSAVRKAGISLERLKHRLCCSVVFAALGFLCSWFLPLGNILAFSGSVLMAPTSFILPALYMMRDLNTYGLASGNIDEDGGFKWNSGFSSTAKRMYILAVFLLVVGVLSVFIGGIGAVWGLLPSEKSSIPSC